MSRVPDTHAQFTDDIPRLYDRHLGPVVFDPYARELASRIAATGPRRVLEIACGTGILTARLREALDASASLVATDLNPPMLQFARAKLPGAAIEWRQADGSRLPFQDGEFDAVACQFGFMFFPDKIAAFREAARVLSPTGALMFSVWNRLEDNPSGRIVHQAIVARFGADAPQFYRVPFGYDNEALIRADLQAAGFTAVDVVRSVIDSDVPSADSLATGLLRGTPMFHQLSERGADLDALEQEVAARIAAELPPSKKMRLDAMVVVAKRR